MAKCKVKNGEAIIPEGETHIGQYGAGTFIRFKDKLKRAVIPNTVTKIGYKTFEGCAKLAEVFLPDSVTTIDEYAFKGCTALKEIVLPESLTEIAHGAFQGCTSLTKIVIPAAVESIDDFVFADSGLTEIVVAEGNTEYDSRDNCNAIIEKETDTLIVGSASTVIPDSVVTIGDGAFWGCKELKEIHIPESVVEIKRHAFWGCAGLTEIFIPKTVHKIEYGAFACCPNLKSIVVDEKNHNYDSRENCNAIIERKNDTLVASCPSTVIPASVKKLQLYAFCGSVIPEIVVPENVDVCDSTFAHITTPARIILPHTMKDIESCLFDGSSGLTEVVIPDSVRGIWRNAFCGCSGLTEVVIPNSVHKIADKAFKNCSGLQKIIIPDSVTDVEAGAFEGCSGATEIKFSRKMRIINVAAFRGCSGLKSLIIPSCIEALYFSAFEDCSGLEELVIPWSVTSICRDAFSGCTGLKTVTLNCEISIDEPIFKDSHNITTITFGEGIKKLDGFWGEWANKVEVINIPAKKMRYFKSRIPSHLHDKIVELPAE